MPIKILPSDIAIKIAAGEVVERPAAVVKELLDNAVDAGAHNIRVEVRGGGQQQIRVMDDGSGIPADELETAFQRHATSKIGELADLFKINTLGFRGEALPSIASVSKTSMVSRTADDTNGTEVTFEGGVLRKREPRGAPRGTIVTVSDLFYNVPARQKFLKSVAAESGQISSIVSQYALAYPAIRFSLTLDGRTAFQSSGSGDLLDAITQVYGADISKAMLPVGKLRATQSDDNEQPTSDADAETGEMPISEDDLWQMGENGVAERRTRYSVEKKTIPLPKVWGYVSQPTLTRANRQYINFFVNHRTVQSRTLGFAVEEAYHTLLMSGRHPVAVLNIELDPANVDANVHPQKVEVKFADERGAFIAVQRAVREALAAYTAVPNMNPAKRENAQDGADQGELHYGPTFEARPVPLPPSADGEALPARPPINMEAAAATLRDGESDTAGAEIDYSNMTPDQIFDLLGSSSAGRQPAVQQVARIEEDKTVASRRNLPPLRVVGQISETYIIAEGPDGMYMVDQHAAHERVMYERILAELTQPNGKRAEVATQLLLTPLPLELTPRQRAEVESRLDVLAELGFEMEAEGERTLLVKSVPAMFKQRHESGMGGALVEMLDDLLNQRRVDLWRDTLAITLACHSAIRAGQSLPLEEMRRLIEQLEQCRMPRACAHGRPTMLLLSQSQLEREFKRTV